MFFFPSSSKRRMALRKATLPSPIVMRPSMSSTVTSPACRSRMLSSAMIQSSPLTTVLEFLYHAHRSAAVGPRQPPHIVHEGAHQKHAPSRGLQNVCGIGWVGHFSRIESLALILDFDLQHMFLTIERHFNCLGFVFLIAVDDRVGDCLAHGHVNSERGLFPNTAIFNKARSGGSSGSNRLDVAGQNESSRLFGHKGHGLSCRGIALRAAAKYS